ncbi:MULTISPECIES: hypothetical protein [Cyanophyceae]|uniref:hypothetical protein n=1 Tax=Cyanophyceae TaxID=3028117 RepID=UPI0016895758|nr:MULTISPECIES: hypothetical protein [Cyanophyceae]MBD1917438.1 hypothetical protein [Phormidium sp. FACHB-77]MBD2032317.1 hypothetical protein [Phormidium sp. FACHB-322]MBD2052255.1 hypothetical protein [Leptolyngbya sp. FACHB-60]
MKPTHVAFALAIIGTAIPSVSNLGNFASQVSTARAEASRIGDDMTELTLSQQEQAQKNEVAIARYQNGCIPVVSADQLSYVSLVLNLPVIDSVSGQPIPVGSVVCDAHGNTGVITDDDSAPNTPGVTQKMAFTGDKSLVDRQLSQYQGAAYYMPSN